MKISQNLSYLIPAAKGLLKMDSPCSRENGPLRLEVQGHVWELELSMGLD